MRKFFKKVRRVIFGRWVCHWRGHASPDVVVFEDQRVGIFCPRCWLIFSGKQAFRDHGS